MSMALQQKRVPVWDAFVRVGHWALVAAFTVAYLTGEGEGNTTTTTVHAWSGYAIGVIIVLRILWGFVGPTHARFVDFVYRPASVLRYLIDLVLGRARRYIGHSPAGGAMALVLLVCLTATAASGLVAYGDQGKGPLASGLPALVTHAYAETNKDEHRGRAERRSESAESAIGDLHGTLANLTLALVVLHVLGVGLASIAHRENLVGAMIVGKKRGEG
jgi:cytochrome b